MKYGKILGLIVWTMAVVATLSTVAKAGKVTWDKDGKATIAGTSGQGCTQSGFGTEDNKTKDKKCD